MEEKKRNKKNCKEEHQTERVYVLLIVFKKRWKEAYFSSHCDYGTVWAVYSEYCLFTYNLQPYYKAKLYHTIPCLTLHMCDDVTATG